MCGIRKSDAVVGMKQVLGGMVHEANLWSRVRLGHPDDLIHGQVMEKTYSKTKCPQDTSSTAFSGTCIYWRPSGGGHDVAIAGLAQGVPSVSADTSGKDKTKVEAETARKLQQVALDD